MTTSQFLNRFSILTSLALLFSINALAQVTFENPYIYIPIKGSNATAGYVQIKNDGLKDILFTVKSVEGFKKAEVHETIEKDGRMAMQKVDSFLVKAKSSLTLEPGGKHIMLFDAEKKLQVGGYVNVVYSIDGTLKTEKFKLVERNVNSGHKH